MALSLWTVSIRSIFAITALVGFASVAQARQWTVSVLDPIGSTQSIANRASGGNQGGWVSGLGNNAGRAILWSGSQTSFIDLHPIGINNPNSYSSILGVSEGGGVYQVGYVYNGQPGTDSHAFLWGGTAGSAIDLNPSGYYASAAYAVTSDGSMQVGISLLSSQSSPHAFTWSGLANTAVDINPAGFDSSYAFDATSSYIVGYGSGIPTGGKNHALKFLGSGNYIDLNPLGFETSYAQGAWGNLQAGGGITTTNNEHALLWQGSANSAIDLNPSGFSDSGISDIFGNRAVGQGRTSTVSQSHALLWDDVTSSNVIDLHNAAGLSSLFRNSAAYGIDDTTGDIVGIGQTYQGTTHALLWRYQSTPASITPEMPGAPQFVTAFLSLGFLFAKRRPRGRGAGRGVV